MEKSERWIYAERAVEERRFVGTHCTCKRELRLVLE
jgi:hypothetical protein